MYQETNLAIVHVHACTCVCMYIRISSTIAFCVLRSNLSNLCLISLFKSLHHMQHMHMYMYM